MAKKRSGGGRATTAHPVAKFLGLTALAGAVAAGLALPAVGGLGLAAKSTVQGFDALPTNLTRPPLSQRTTILDADGGKIADVYSRDRTVVPLSAVAPSMRQAIVAIEDARFYRHGALDLKGILRALDHNARGGDEQGASTLTQQYVKNVAIEEAGNDPTKVAQATQQTMGRKIKELKYAIQVEKQLSKKQILQNYLNITFFGQQAYGVEAAAQRYFSTSAKDLTLPQSALLAGLVQSPTRWDPVTAPNAAKQRRNAVLHRMAAVGDISAKEARKAAAAPLGLRPSQPRNGCITAGDGAGFFCDYVRQVVLNDHHFGKTRKARAARWERGGLTIRTTLKPQAQRAVQASVQKHVRKSDSVATAATLVQPGTGRILGMGQSRPYGFGTDETQINLSVDQDMGGGAGYQPGSTFKPVLAAAALDRGTSPYQQYKAPYKMHYPSPVTTCKGAWTGKAPVENENKSEHGPYRMKEALAKSVNTYFVSLIGDTGVCPVTDMAKKMGIERADGRKIDQVPSITLGTQEMSPLTMATGYATFANRGIHCTPVAIASITDADGKQLPVPRTHCNRAMSTRTADTMNGLLRGVVEDGTGKAAGLPGRDSAGKTGTTDNRYAAWFVGYTPQLSGAVWVGDPEHRTRMTHLSIGGVYHNKVYGGDVPGPIWRDAMAAALAGQPAEKLHAVKIKDDRKPKKPRRPKGGGKPHGHDIGGIHLPPGFIGGGGNGGGGNGGGGNGGGGGWPF